MLWPSGSIQSSTSGSIPSATSARTIRVCDFRRREVCLDDFIIMEMKCAFFSTYSILGNYNSCATAAMKKMKDTGLRVHYAKDQKPPVGPANIKSLLATMIRNGYAFFVTQTSRLHRLHISFCFDTNFSLIRITNAGPRVLEKIRLPPRQLNAMVKRAKLWLPPLRIGCVKFEV